MYKTRQQNLALLQTYGANAWRIQNYLLEATAKNVEKALEELREMTIEVNRERKNTQVRTRSPFCRPCLTSVRFIGSARATINVPRNTLDGTYFQHSAD